jgi:SnoaL-like domain
MSRRVQLILAALVVAGLGLWWWQGGSSREREVRALFDGFASEFNSGASDGIGLLARAAHIGEYFTPDVVIELGQGSPPIQGRETLMGMASRLQPRTSAFMLEFDDVNVEFSDPDHGEVTFTALFRRRSQGSGEESIDAREFAGEVVRSGGRWRVSKVVAVDTLR